MGSLAVEQEVSVVVTAGIFQSLVPFKNQNFYRGLVVIKDDYLTDAEF
jgi:hypothetical protein